MRFGVLAALVAVLSCACEERPSPTTAESTPRAPGRDTTGPAEPSDPATHTEPAEPEGWFGRWKGSAVCLELYPTGEARISLFGKGPKIVIDATATQRAIDATHVELSLRATRIHKHKWVSSCRKRVERPALLDSHDVLGTTMSLEATVAFTLARAADGAVEMCGERCQSLAAETPRLAGRWRRPELYGATRAEVQWSPGEVADLAVDAHFTTIEVGAPDGTLVGVTGYSEVKALGPGSFEIVFKPHTIDADLAEVRALGVTLHIDVETRLRVERVVGGVEVCGADSTCSRVPRYDDPV